MHGAQQRGVERGIRRRRHERPRKEKNIQRKDSQVGDHQNRCGAMRQLSGLALPPAKNLVKNRQHRQHTADEVQLAGGDQRGDRAENEQQQRTLKKSLGRQSRDARGSDCGGHGESSFYHRPLNRRGTSARSDNAARDKSLAVAAGRL